MREPNKQDGWLTCPGRMWEGTRKMPGALMPGVACCLIQVDMTCRHTLETQAKKGTRIDVLLSGALQHVRLITGRSH
jgi:hypothetical protein